MRSASTQTAFARSLRRSETDAERKLWRELRARQFSGVKFRRQQPIGRYIADFCCFDINLVIELDGGQHADQVERDRRRTAYLKRLGFAVIRFWNHTVLTETDTVLHNIYETIQELSHRPHPIPLPGGEGKK